MNLNVVVVDDDAVVLFLHKILIQKSVLPARVKDFNDAEKALAYLKNASPQNHTLIFLDINMPGLNGWEFLERLEHMQFLKKVFVVVVTSSINRSDRERAEKYPCVIDYREKPLSKQVCEEVYIKLLPLLNPE